MYYGPNLLVKFGKAVRRPVRSLLIFCFTRKRAVPGEFGDRIVRELQMVLTPKYNESHIPNEWWELWSLQF